MVQATMGALEPFVTQAWSIVPNLFYATVLLVVGYIAGRIIYSIIDRLLEHTEVDKYFAEEGHLELQLSDLFAEMTKWIVYIVALQAAISLLAESGVPGVSVIQQHLNAIVSWIPGVIGAVAVFLAGYGIAIYTKDHIVGSETLYADLLGKTIFFFVIYIAAAMALDIPQGINPTLLNNILLIIVASLGLAFAIAAGWGLKDVVREEARKYIDDQS
jgi:uncharacterized membrane protein